MEDEPSLPPEVAGKIAALSCGDRMKSAVTLVAQGLPYREAAAAQGYADHRETYRWAKRAGLLEVHSTQLVAGFRRVAELSSAEIERRLVEEPEQITTKDLAVIAGISADKIAKAERWGSDGGRNEDQPNRWLGALSAVLERGGATLTVSIEPSESEPGSG